MGQQYVGADIPFSLLSDFHLFIIILYLGRCKSYPHLHRPYIRNLRYKCVDALYLAVDDDAP